MFSIFPTLLSFDHVVPLLLRVTLGLIFILWAYSKFRIDRTKSILEGIVGILLFIGFVTQLAALFACGILGFRLFKKIKERAFLTDGVNYYLILFVIALSLLFTGAGFFALDLPL